MIVLHPLHLEDLRRSGLADRTIAEAGIASVPPDRIAREIGCVSSGLQSCYRIPYDPDFARYRCFYAEGARGPKYLQRKGTGNHLYIPEAVSPMLHDASRVLLITEGEKKSLKASQEGLACIALSGLWNWSDGKGRLIADFERIALENRTVEIVPDNDWLQLNKHGYKKNLEAAVYGLAERLKKIGAHVCIRHLPEGPDKGLDDFLCTHTVEEFKALLVTACKSLDERVDEAGKEDVEGLLPEIACLRSETERAVLIRALAKRLGIGTRALTSDIGKIRKSDAKPEGNASPAYSANFPNLVDIALDDEGAVAYIVKNSGSLSLVHEAEADGRLLVPPDLCYLPFSLPRASEVMRHYGTDRDHKLFEDVNAYLRRFSHLEAGQFLIVAANVFLSYLQDHPDVAYLPMILFYAVPERGKSRTGKAASNVSFRGVHVVDLREANLFRSSQDLKATLFFDLLDLSKKAERNGCEDILLLRYERGAKVGRVLYPDKGPFRDTVFYSVFGPTWIATNEPLHKITETRCIPITMPNKPGQYDDPTPDRAQELKDRLTAFRARVGGSLPHVNPVQGINARLWDISQPLLQVVKLVYPEALGELTRELQRVANERIEDRKGSIEGRIAALIEELSPLNVDDWKIKTARVLERLNENRPEDHKYSSQYLGKKLKAMGIRTRLIEGHSHIDMRRDDLEVLMGQYDNSDLPAPQENSPHSPNSPKHQQATTCAGESGEFRQGPDDTHRPLDVEKQGFGDNGESGDSPKEADVEEIILTDFVVVSK